MKTVVITGSTRGIGYGLADEFLKRGHQVVISGRSNEGVEGAVARLSAQYGMELMLGQACDVTDFGQVQALWGAAVARFGRVDIWINNAGISHPRAPLWEQSATQIEAVVDANLLGAMYGAKVALAGMLRQGGGQLYNMEGLGSGGPVTPGLSLYGATKAGLTYLTRALIREVRDTPVYVCFLSPGMVVTDLLTEGYTNAELERTKRVFNILADRVETVAPYLVARILTNDKQGARIVWLTKPKATWRFMTAWARKRDLFDKPT